MRPSSGMHANESSQSTRREQARRLCPDEFRPITKRRTSSDASCGKQMPRGRTTLSQKCINNGSTKSISEALDLNTPPDFQASSRACTKHPFAFAFVPRDLQNFQSIALQKSATIRHVIMCSFNTDNNQPTSFWHMPLLTVMCMASKVMTSTGLTVLRSSRSHKRPEGESVKPMYHLQPLESFLVSNTSGSLHQISLRPDVLVAGRVES